MAGIAQESCVMEAERMGFLKRSNGQISQIDKQLKD